MREWRWCLKVLGVDPSTHCGWAVVSRDGIVDTGTLHAPKSPEISRMHRWSTVSRGVVALAQEHDCEYAMVEDYVRMSRFVSSISYEIGACVRLDLWRAGVPFYEVSPTSLKKFVTGRGNAKKKDMLAAGS